MAVINSSVGIMKKALATDSTNSSAFVEPIAIIQQPTGLPFIDPITSSNDGLFQVASSISGGTVENSLLVMPIGTGGNTKDFRLRVYGWFPSRKSDGSIQIEPFLLLGVKAITNNTAKLTAADYVTSGSFCDTVTYVEGDATARYYSTSGARGGFAVDIMGAAYISFLFTLSGASAAATAMNALWKQVS